MSSKTVGRKIRQLPIAACRAIKQYFYMDDLLSGADTKEDAIKLRDDIITVLNSAGFELSKWSSNTQEL